VDFVLVELIALTLLSVLGVAIGGARALPWTTAAERDGNAVRAVSSAAERGVVAFLDVDYRDMDGGSDKVIKLSANPFRAQYSQNATDLRVAAIQAQSVARGTIRAVGMNRINGDTADALIAADTVVTSSNTKNLKATRSCPRDGARCARYRFLVSLVRVDGTWLMSDLAEAP
jgi:hypothetical protein